MKLKSFLKTINHFKINCDIYISCQQLNIYISKYIKNNLSYLTKEIILDKLLSNIIRMDNMDLFNLIVLTFDINKNDILQFSNDCHRLCNMHLFNISKATYRHNIIFESLLCNDNKWLFYLMDTFDIHRDEIMIEYLNGLSVPMIKFNNYINVSIQTINELCDKLVITNDDIFNYYKNNVKLIEYSNYAANILSQYEMRKIEDNIYISLQLFLIKKYEIKNTDEFIEIILKYICVGRLYLKKKLISKLIDYYNIKKKFILDMMLSNVFPYEFIYIVDVLLKKNTMIVTFDERKQLYNNFDKNCKPKYKKKLFIKKYFYKFNYTYIFPLINLI